jgi:methylated-DNA-[protein]-cysteine S-methyltransferase
VSIRIHFNRATRFPKYSKIRIGLIVNLFEICFVNQMDMKQDYVSKTMDSPVGRMILVASQKGLTAIIWEREDPSSMRLGNVVQDDQDPVLLNAENQLKEYFNRERQIFSLDLDFNGTEFQKKVWNALLTIPYGETRTYGEIARQIGSPKSSRAVGAASGKNPISIVAPCHRVIGASGKLVGFGGGLENKALLLNLEKTTTGKQRQISLFS